MSMIYYTIMSSYVNLNTKSIIKNNEKNADMSNEYIINCDEGYEDWDIIDSPILL